MRAEPGESLSVGIAGAGAIAFGAAALVQVPACTRYRVTRFAVPRSTVS